MSMATLSTAFSPSGLATAIIVPRGAHTLTFSYQQLTSHVASFQKRLATLGIAPQDAVSIALPNTYEFIVAFLAASWQRAIAAPLNPAYTQEEFEFHIDDLHSALTIVPRYAFEQRGPPVCAAHKHKAAIAECFWNGTEVVLDVKDKARLAEEGDRAVQQAQPNDVALVLHTSGTTGRPKAVTTAQTQIVPLTHRNLTRSMRNIQFTYQLTSTDRTLLVMPLFHVHGLLAALLAPLISGGSVIVPDRFSASDFWNHFSAYKANWYTAVPTIHQILLRNPLPSQIPSIRFIRSCSSPLSPKTFHALEENFKAPVLEAYAMTEGAHQLSSNPLPPARRSAGSVGIGQGVEIKILDASGDEMPRGTEAEICVRGESITKGYLNNTEANRSSFTQTGFFRTGDQGRQDEHGYVFITGRIKELINKGGEKISPVEIDCVAEQHPSIAEAISFALTDAIYGQDIGLAVVLKDQVSRSPEEIRNWLFTKVARFKVPKRIFVTDHMPKTATGKVQRRMVAEAILKEDRLKARL